MTKHKLKTTIYAVSVATISISLATASFAQSRQNQQSSNALGDVIGMIANASAKSSAKKKWAQVTPEIQQCVNTVFASRSINVDQIIAAGLSPTNENIAPIVTLCQTVMATQLKTDFPCSVTNSKGVQVATTCVQSYAKAANGSWAPVSRNDFLRAASNGEQVNVADFETTVAQNTRLAEEKRLAQAVVNDKTQARPSLHDRDIKSKNLSEMIDFYNSRLIANPSKFQLKDGTLCERPKRGDHSSTACKTEMDKRFEFNSEVRSEIFRLEFLREFSGKRSIKIPGKISVSGDYSIYNEWIIPATSRGEVYIGNSRPTNPVVQGKFLVPILYVSKTPKQFLVPFYNYKKRGGYEGRSDTKIHWTVVDCKKKISFVSTVVYFNGDINNLNYYTKYTNIDSILDTNMVFTGLRILMTTENSFRNSPSSPFTDICA